MLVFVNLGAFASKGHNLEVSAKKMSIKYKIMVKQVNLSSLR